MNSLQPWDPIERKLRPDKKKMSACKLRTKFIQTTSGATVTRKVAYFDTV